MTANRFLIFNNGMIGNTLFNMPAAAWLKQHFPGCFIGMVVDNVGLQLVEHDPNVDIFYRFNKNKDSLMDQFRLIMALRRDKYDVSLHLKKGVRNEVIARLAGAKLRAGFRIKGSPQHLHIKLDEDVTVHRLKSREILLSETFGTEVTFDRPRLHPNPEAEADLDCLLESYRAKRGNYVVVHPTGESQAGHRWCMPSYSGAIDRLTESMPVFVLCMPHEQEMVEQHIPSGPQVHYYTDSLATTSALIRGASVFIGNDSGPAHIACAWDVPRVLGYRIDDGNFTKWQPADMTGCKVLFTNELSPESVFEAAMELKRDTIPDEPA